MSTLKSSTESIKMVQMKRDKKKVTIISFAYFLVLYFGLSPKEFSINRFTFTLKFCFVSVASLSSTFSNFFFFSDFLSLSMLTLLFSFLFFNEHRIHAMNMNQFIFVDFSSFITIIRYMLVSR